MIDDVRTSHAAFEELPARVHERSTPIDQHNNREHFEKLFRIVVVELGVDEDFAHSYKTMASSHEMALANWIKHTRKRYLDTPEEDQAFRMCNARELELVRDYYTNYSRVFDMSDGITIDLVIITEDDRYELI